MSASSTRLVADEVTVCRRGLTLVHRIGLSVGPGTILTMAGASGTGKTTLLRTLAGLTPPDGGRISRPPGRVGVVFQEPRLLPWLTARENIAVVLDGDRAARRRTADAWLARMQLSDAGELTPARLSGGMRQRVAIARAFAVEPTLVLVDEPFSALDRELATQLRHELAALLRQGACIAVWITHDPAEAAEVGDALLRLAGPPSGAWSLDDPPHHQPAHHPPKPGGTHETDRSHALADSGGGLRSAGARRRLRRDR